MKICYCLERVEHYVPAPLGCFKCQKYGCHKEACRGRETWAKCGEMDPEYLEEDCLKQSRCANCRKDHSACTKSCDVYKKETEILKVKHKRNVSFLEARDIVGSYMGENSYTSFARRADTTNQDNGYRILMEKLIRLEANDWPKFQEHLKKLHSAGFYPASAQQRVGNGERSNVVVQTETQLGVVLPLLGHVKGSTGVYHLWARHYFSSSVPHV